MKRLFAALHIERGKVFEEKAAWLAQRLKKEKISWVRPDHMHITLKFLGETPEEKIPAIVDALQKAVHGFSPFEISLESTGIFGSTYNPKVIWFGIRENNELQQLAAQVRESLVPLGYVPDRQNFVPHITLARIRKEIQQKSLFQQSISEIQRDHIQISVIDRVILYESLLRPAGPEYLIIKDFHF